MFSVLTAWVSENPFPPTATQPMFSVSLGDWYPGPPRTFRGTIMNPAAAVAAVPRKARRERPCSGLDVGSVMWSSIFSYHIPP